MAVRPPDKKPPRPRQPRLTKPCSNCGTPLKAQMIPAFAALQPDGTEYPIIRKTLPVLLCPKCDLAAAKGRPRLPKRLGG